MNILAVDNGRCREFGLDPRQRQSGIMRIPLILGISGLLFIQKAGALSFPDFVQCVGASYGGEHLARRLALAGTAVGDRRFQRTPHVY
jgi:hypothetical protein